MNEYSTFINKLKNEKNRNVKGFEFEKFALKFLLNYKNLDIEKGWLYNDIPFSIKKNLNLPKKDKGVDILLKTNLNDNLNEDEYIIVQVKFRSLPYRKISWGKNLATFEAMLSRTKTKGILFTNSFEITDLKYNKDIIHILGDDIINDIECLNFIFNENENNKTYIHKDLTIRQYQQDIIDKSISHFENENKGIIICATGTGKTFISRKIFERMNIDNLVIIVPSLFLLSQTYTKYNPFVKGIYKIKCIGSDFYSQENENDFENTSFSIQQNKKCFITTDELEIKNFLTTSHKKIVICTYQSLNILLNVCVDIDFKFDFSIFDEAHHTAGNNINSKNLEKCEHTFLKMLFQTATKRTFTLKDSSEEELSNDNSIDNSNEENSNEETNEESNEIDNSIDNEIEDDFVEYKCMNNEKVYGKIISEYSIRDGINDGFLSDYNIITYLSFTELRSNVLFEDEKITPRDISNAILILKSMLEQNITHLITYHTYNSEAFRMKNILLKLIKHSKEFSKLKKMFVQEINGNMSMSIRKKIIKEFIESEYSIITNARVLCEGIDIPIVDGICFCSNKNSNTDIIQTIGRSLRKYKNKEKAKIIVPAFLRDTEDFFENRGDLANIRSILKALSEHDTSIIDEIKIKKGSGVFENQRIKFIVNSGNSKNGKSINEEVITKNIDLENIINEIESIIYDRFNNDINFDLRFEGLKEFIIENKRLPRDNKNNCYKEKSLEQWCRNNRGKYKKGLLKKEYIIKLESLNEIIEGIWFWDGIIKNKNKIIENAYKVKEFYKVNNRLPSESSKNKEEKSLGKWCSHRRTDYKNNKIDKEVNDILESIEGWFWDGNIENKNKMIENALLVKKFYEINKKLPYEKSKNNQEKKLGLWRSHRRNDYKNNSLDKEIIDILESIEGWYWDGDIENKNKMIENSLLVKEFYEINNRLPSRNSKNQEEKRLGSCCSEYRRKYKKNKLDKEIIDILSSIEGWYWDIKNKMIENALLVKEFYEINNRLPYEKSKNNEEKRLGKWCSSRRQNYKNNSLDKEIIDILESIKGWKWSR